MTTPHLIAARHLAGLCFGRLHGWILAASLGQGRIGFLNESAPHKGHQLGHDPAPTTRVRLWMDAATPCSPGQQGGHQSPTNGSGCSSDQNRFTLIPDTMIPNG